MSKGRLFVISGPSGAGKGTICRRLIDEIDVDLSVSFTTRAPRPDETDGESYRFITIEEFEKMIKAGGFLEYAKVYGNYYGTPKHEVLDMLRKGRDVILEIDVQGAAQIRAGCSEGIFIFFLPPSMEELVDRIKKRGTETDEAINLRLNETMNEISHIGEYDYCVINEEIAETVESVKAIITAQRYKITDDTDKFFGRYKEETDALSIN